TARKAQLEEGSLGLLARECTSEAGPRSLYVPLTVGTAANAGVYAVVLRAPYPIRSLDMTVTDVAADGTRTTHVSKRAIAAPDAPLPTIPTEIPFAHHAGVFAVELESRDVHGKSEVLSFSFPHE